MTQPELQKMDAYWRASNYLAAGQLYLLDNPLLRRPLKREDVKRKIVGHWGTVPGQNFVYVHLNRIIKKYDQDLILISGPGHGGNFFVANAYLDGTYSEVYPNISRDEEGMVAQHAKWLKVCNQLPWRQSIASLNLILSSNVWQQDHNGYTHQDPGFLDHIANKKADVVRLYLPPDTNCLLSCFDHCVRSRDYVNVLVTSKHPRPQWLTMEQAVKHCTQGVGIWDWASSDAGQEPDIVMACCGDTPTLETLAAVTILRDAMPELKIRVVNVVDLMKLEPNTKHPHGLTDADYDTLFTKDKPIIFAFHGYPTLVHELTYERTNRNLSVHGYQEEGTITTPFDMRVQNEIDRFHLVKDALLHLPQLGNKGAYLIQQMNDKLIAHKNYIHEVGQDMPEILDWKWHLSENR